ncbi:hypothetical protein BSKO_01439 [Bryopsis sp. KO-2023]|nr:hypothetical protein BSKO_01439 [Bryopsis sp. KO-2023]
MEHQKLDTVWNKWQVLGWAAQTSLVTYVWRLLNALYAGLSVLALYLYTPISWLTSRHIEIPKTLDNGQNQHAPGASGLICQGLREYLLPPLKPQDKGKMTVVLDLDETLITSHLRHLVPTSLRMAAKRGDVLSHEVICDPGTGKPTTVVMFTRPGVFEFLGRLSRFAEVVIFTAGAPFYAEPLINLLDPNHKVFSGRLYRSATVDTPRHEYVKDLSRLGRDLRRTVLVDNRPYSFLLQPANGIPCTPFRGRVQDGQLLGVILPLLESLSYVRDIRPVLNNHFKMASWFRSKGCDVPNKILE